MRHSQLNQISLITSINTSCITLRTTNFPFSSTLNRFTFLLTTQTALPPAPLPRPLRHLRPPVPAAAPAPDAHAVVDPAAVRQPRRHTHLPLLRPRRHLSLPAAIPAPALQGVGHVANCAGVQLAGGRGVDFLPQVTWGRRLAGGVAPPAMQAAEGLFDQTRVEVVGGEAGGVVGVGLGVGGVGLSGLGGWRVDWVRGDNSCWIQDR